MKKIIATKIQEEYNNLCNVYNNYIRKYKYKKVEC